MMLEKRDSQKCKPALEPRENARAENSRLFKKTAQAEDEEKRTQLGERRKPVRKMPNGKARLIFLSETEDTPGRVCCVSIQKDLRRKWHRLLNRRDEKQDFPTRGKFRKRFTLKEYGTLQ